jgi:hypothetical protein
MSAVNTKRLHPVILIVFACLCGCAVVRTPATAQVALLAPFEGRYREFGYNALYAARLAFADSPNTQYEFLPVDDGGSLERAVDRAQALVLDSRLVAVVVLGYDAADPATLAAFADVPVLIVGNWSTPPERNTVFLLSNPAVNAQLTAPPYADVTDAATLEAPLIGGEVFGLRGFVRLRDSLSGIMVVSSGSLPDPEFADRYRQSDPFAPEPGLLATLTYDAFRMILQTHQTNRANMSAALNDTSYEGLNGVIRLEDGFWEDAPIHIYQYQDGLLTTADDIVE